MHDVPRDLPIVERRAVRVVVIDSLDRVLLFHTREPVHPELGTWWELPGGGIDAGESYAEAALRELREEAGIVAMPQQVGPPSWRRRATFKHRDVRRLQDEVIVSVRLTVHGPDVDGSARLPAEVEDYFGFRWWTIQDVITSRLTFYPRRLPALLGDFLAGKQIDEPLEVWS